MLASKKRMIKITDNAPRPYKCTVCPQAFKQKGHLQQHMRIHMGVKPYRCDLCGYASTIRGNLTSHIKLRHSNNNHKLRKFRCPHCGLYFKFFDSLTVHIASRHSVHVSDKQGGGLNSNTAPRPQVEERQMAPPPQHQHHQQQQHHHQQPQPQQDELLHQSGMHIPMNVLPDQAESFQFPATYNLPRHASNYPEPAVQMMGQSQDDTVPNNEVQQWEVINNSDIEARNDGAVETQANPISVEMDNSDIEMKTERGRFLSCDQEQETPVSSSPLVSIGYSPASIQQKLKFSSQSKVTHKDSIDQTREENSGSHGDRLGTREEETTDTGISSLSFSEDEQNGDRGPKVGSITSTTHHDTGTENIQSLSSDGSHSEVILVEKSREVPNMTSSRRRTAKQSASSPATFRDLQASSNFSGHSPTPVSPLSLSHHSTNSPGVHMLSSSNQPIPSPSASSIPAGGGPARKLATKRSKFQNKDSLQCEFCDIVFGDTVLHTIHMGWHSHHHPFQCGVCGHQCKDKYDFMCHFTRGHDS